METFRLLAVLAQASGNRDLAKFATATGDTLARIAEIEASATMSEYAQDVALGVVTFNYLSIIVSMEQQSEQQVAMQGMEDLISQLAKHIDERFARLEGIIHDQFVAEMNVLGSVKKDLRDLKITAGLLAETLLGQRTTTIAIDELQAKINELTKKIDDVTMTQALIELGKASFDFKILPAADRSHYLDLLIRELGKFALVMAAYPPFVLKESYTSTAARYTQAFSEASRTYPSFLNSSSLTKPINLQVWLRVAAALSSLKTTYPNDVTPTFEAVSRQIADKGNEFSTLLGPGSHERITVDPFMNAAIEYQAEARQLNRKLGLAEIDFQIKKSFGANFSYHTLNRDSILSATRAKYRDYKMIDCGLYNVPKEDPRYKIGREHVYAFPIALLDRIDEIFLAADVTNEAPIDWCVQPLSYLAYDRTAVHHDGHDDAVTVSASVEGRVIFTGAVQHHLSDQVQVIRDSYIKEWPSIAIKFSDINVEQNYENWVENHIYAVDAYIQKDLDEKHIPMNDQSRIGVDRYRDQALKSFNECFREPDPMKYKEKGCDKEPKGKQEGNCCQRDAYLFFSHSERVLFRHALFKRVLDRIVPICREKITLFRDLAHDPELRDIVSKLDFARSKIIWSAALFKEETAETERFLFPESSSLNGLIGGEQIDWLLVGKDDETKNFEGRLSYGIVCPLSPAPQIDAVL